MRKLCLLLCMLAAPALALATTDSQGRTTTHPTNDKTDHLYMEPGPAWSLSITAIQKALVSATTSLEAIRLAAVSATTSAEAIRQAVVSATTSLEAIRLATVSTTMQLASLIGRSNLDLLGIGRTQTGMSNAAGDFVAAHVLPIGVLDTVSCYTVALAVTPTDLVPAALVGASHIAITNLGNQSFYIGGTDVSTTNGVVLAQNATYTMDGVNRRTKVYAVKTGVPTQTVAVMRW